MFKRGTMAASNDPFGDLSDSVELSEANVAAFLSSSLQFSLGFSVVIFPATMVGT